VEARGGEANIARTVVTLPNSELVDNAHIKEPCTRVEFSAKACPSGSEIGFARAETPLLEKPLEGPVYLRTSGHRLPDIVAALNGQIDIVLDGQISTVHGRLRTTFATVPDAPVSKFTLNLDGGSKGLLENDRNLCRASLKATATLDGQNRTRDNQSQELAAPCGRRVKHKRHQRRKGRVASR
jgi:hypothetical protein